MGDGQVDLGEEVFVKARDLGPPQVNESPESKSDEVIDFCFQLGREVKRIEQWWNFSIGGEMGKEKTFCWSGARSNSRLGGWDSIGLRDDEGRERTNEAPVSAEWRLPLY